MLNDYNNIIPDLTYDITDDEEKILASLRYLDLADEYKLIQRVRITGQVMSLLKTAPSFKLPQIIVNAGKGPVPSGVHNDTDKTMTMLRTILNNPGSAERIITGIRCRTAIKEKLLACIRDNETGLDKVIPVLMLMNLKNYQAGIKEAVEKLILIKHAARWRDGQHGSGDAFIDERLEDIEHILSMSFSDYYKDFTDTAFTDAFNNKLHSVFKDDKIERLIESMKHDDWALNIRTLKHSISYGSEYISIMTENRKLGKLNNVIDPGDKPGRSIARYKIIDVFTREFIPGNAVTLKKLNRLVRNYFTPSTWRRKTVCMLKAVNYNRNTFRLLLVPCNDASMVYRHLSGNDCTSDMDLQLMNHASSFYKIMYSGNWVGYISLLKVNTPDRIKAVLVDVININSVLIDSGLNIESLFEGFADGLMDNFYEKGLRYLLIPSSWYLLSNSDTDSIYYRYSKYPVISGPLSLFYEEGGEYVEKDSFCFQSLESDKYIIVRDFELHGQGVLDGCE